MDRNRNTILFTLHWNNYRPHYSLSSVHPHTLLTFTLFCPSVSVGGACCSIFGDQGLYDGVTIAGLVLPTNATTAKSMDRRRSLMPGTGSAAAAAAIYDQPEEAATIRWPAPPLFTIEDEQQRSVVKQVRNRIHPRTTDTFRLKSNTVSGEMEEGWHLYIDWTHQNDFQGRQTMEWNNTK